jgi:hypothetical protein
MWLHRETRLALEWRIALRGAGKWRRRTLQPGLGPVRHQCLGWPEGPTSRRAMGLARAALYTKGVLGGQTSSPTLFEM